MCIYTVKKQIFLKNSKFSQGVRDTTERPKLGGSNYDSLFVRTVAFPVQVAYWIKEVIAPCGYSVPCQF